MLVLAACGTSSNESAAPSMDELRNAAYHDVVPVPVKLVGGRFEGDAETKQYTPRLIVVLADEIYASGDLTGDGTDEAIGLLTVNFGGSGVFESFVIAGRSAGETQHLASINLGDRPKVEAVSIEQGVLAADLIVHGPDDPMCCPTQSVRREWRFENGDVIEIKTAVSTPPNRYRGHLVWGHESRSFTECGEERSGWVVNEAGDELLEVYEELTSSPYQPMFVEVRGTWGDAPAEGFGADYPEMLTITELLRAENEGFGCRLELEGMQFIASGNEPSWRLQLRQDDLILRRMASPDGSVFKGLRKSGDESTIVFEASGADGDIRITLEKRRCIDSMSGARHAYAATLDHGGATLEGCAVRGL
jgi:uncharacterized membrane protein